MHFYFCKGYKSLLTHALIHFLAQLFKLIFITHILKTKKISDTRHCLAEKSKTFVIINETNAVCIHTLVFSNAQYLMF